VKNRMAFLIAVGALALPASAQNAEWKFYGTLVPTVDNIQTTGATTDTAASNSLVNITAAGATNVPARNRITYGTSNMGIRGSYKLSNDLKVIWQMESSTSLDGDAPSVLAGRNCMLGLAGDSWGQAFVGSWDTPYKIPTIQLGAIRANNPFDANLMGNPGFNVPGTVTNSGRAGTKNDAAFNRRQGNSLQYWTPDFSGFTARVAYSVGETKPLTDAATTAQINPTLVSALLSYKIGGLSLFLGHEEHNDYFGLSQMLSQAPTLVGGAATLTNASSKDVGNEFVAYYTIASTGTRITVLAEQLKYHNNDTVGANINEYKRFAWIASVQQTLGAHVIFGNYGKANVGSASKVNGTATNVTGLGATEYCIGYKYAMSKTADIFASYYGVTNEKAATYGLFPLIGGGTAGVTPGADTKGVGIGMLFTW